MKISAHISRLLVPALVMGLMSGAALAPAQPERLSIDELAPLKDAIQLAGVTALTSAQESNIRALIATFKNTHKPSFIAAAQEARTTYENAILYGDNVTAESQAEIIGKAQAAEMIQREKDVAIFAINVISILRSNPGQVEGLVLRFGGSRIVRLAISFVEKPDSSSPDPSGFAPILRSSDPGSRGRLPSDSNQ
jgi:hypothetical protein